MSVWEDYEKIMAEKGGLTKTASEKEAHDEGPHEKPWGAEKFESCIEKVKARPGFKPYPGRTADESARAICAEEMWAESSGDNEVKTAEDECPECDSYIDDLVRVADSLDKKGFIEEANMVDAVLKEVVASAYTKFVSKFIKQYRKKHPDASVAEAMKAAGKEWKKKKGKGKKEEE